MDKITGTLLHKEKITNKIINGINNFNQNITESETKTICSNSFDPFMPINIKINGRNLIRIQTIKLVIHKNKNEFINKIFSMNYYNGEGWLSKNKKDCSKNLGDHSSCSSNMTLLIEEPFQNYIDMHDGEIFQ